jgi:hypothetical protein
MPRSSIADAIVAWENAVTNARANAMDVPGMEGYLTPLEQILAQAKDLTARLEMRKGVKQEETKDRRALMQAGKGQVSRIRSAIKAFYGPTSERVIEFGARPLRPRTKKVKQPPATPPPVSAPGTTGSPPPHAAETPKPAAAPAGGKDEAPRNPTTE